MFKVALVGAGRIGRIHARNVAAHPELELAYVVDPAAAAAAETARGTGAAVADVDAALGDPAVAGVVVASATDTHLALCRAAHRAGKAVLCEKPVDLDLARAEAAAAELADARIVVGFNRRFDPSFAALRARLADGALGALESLGLTSNDPAPPPPSYVAGSGGLFRDMAIHDFDMARWLLPEEPVEVFAWGAALVDARIGEAGDVDTARTLLRTASGRLCVIANSRRSGFGYDQRIEAFCAGGRLAAENVHATTVETWTEGGRATDAFQNFFLDRYREAYVLELAHFADVLAGRAAPRVTFADGVAALRLAEAAGASLARGAPVRVAPGLRA